MEFDKVLQKRRSIRRFDEKGRMDREIIEDLICAAQYAPSWKNSQTGRYYCAISVESVKKVREECLPQFNQNSTEGAMAYIVTTFVKGISGFDKETHLPVNEVGEGWGSYDLGMQNQNLLLRASELGLSTLVMGIRNEEKLREVLNIPPEEQVMAVIAVGYSTLEPAMPQRKNVSDISKFY